MNKEEMAGEMLHHLYEGRTDEIGMICDVIRMCRDHAVRDRKNKIFSSIYTREEADIVIAGGKLADEVFALLQQDDLNGIEKVLKTYKS